jgi:hypothetical protein
MPDWKLVAVPRRYAPSWLWGWIPNPLRSRILAIPPVNWLLFRPVNE